MWTALALCLSMLLPAAPAGDEQPLELSIDAVTLYRNSVMVHRQAKQVVSGTYIVTGLPGELHDDRTRVRFIGGHVVSVELHERVLENAPVARIEQLRHARELAREDLLEAEDAVRLQSSSVDYLARLVIEEGDAWRREREQGTVDVERWDRNRAWLHENLNAARVEHRAALEQRQAAEKSLRALDEEWSELTGAGGVIVKDLVIRVVTDQTSGRLEVDTQLPSAGWEPLYDLRTAGDATSVELAYRARVRQNTGEDWNEVRVLLSTAQPELGAQGPDPIARWVDLHSPAPRAGLSVGRYADAEVAESAEATWDDDGGGLDALSEVVQEGLSVRFELPGRESIESREAPTSVLVGRERLDVEPEYYCAPSRSQSVWLRGRATNSGKWTLLPGEASVFFGADYLGRSRLDLVQPGQEFMLHLGAEDAIELKRTQVGDQTEGPGFFGSKRAQVEEWSIELTNHGAAIAAADGSTHVIIQEALPRTGDDRIEVVLEHEQPKHSKDERWRIEREDRSIYTWLLHVPLGKSAGLGYRVSVRYPKNTDLYIEEN